MDKVDFEFKINNKYYNEYYARYLLEYFYSDIFTNAKVVDRPDIWIDRGGSVAKSVGVEVTTLLDTYYNTLKRYRRAWAEQELSLEQIAKSVPALLRNKLGVNSHGNLILLGKHKNHSLSKSLAGLESTIKIKLEKLKSYKYFDETSLFIFATNLSPSCTIEKIFEKIKQIDKSSYQRLFDYILIFNYESLQVYPFAASGQPEIHMVTEETRFFCDKLAEIEEKRISNEYVNKKEQKRVHFKKHDKKSSYKTFGDDG